MLGAELTQKQGVIFRYLARLMVTIPGATIHTLMQLMDDGKPFKKYMDQLDGSARYFFQTEFFHPSFAATKKQILRRLWGVLSTPAFERMFAQRSNKLDLFEAMNEGKIVLVSTAKDLLKEDGSALFGRFFIAMLKQAALERSVLQPEDRNPAYVYIDEAQEYFDDSIETILNQARKYNVGLTLAHQTLDQLSPRLRSAILTNTSFKCAGGVSAKDARGLADELRTTPDFIESMKRRGERSEFAAWLKHSTPRAIRLTVPLGFLERQPLLTEEAFGAVMEQTRDRYCGTLADVVGFDGIWVVPGSPYENRDGVLAAIGAARAARIPLLGTCGGFQHLLLEFARNVCGLLGVENAEQHPGAPELLIVPLACSLLGEEATVIIESGSIAARAMGAGPSTERFFCRYGLSAEYEGVLERHGLVISGRDELGDARIAELPGHPFFVGSLFQPELTSDPTWVHPLIVSFAAAVRIRAASREGAIR